MVPEIPTDPSEALGGGAGVPDNVCMRECIPHGHDVSCVERSDINHEKIGADGFMTEKSHGDGVGYDVPFLPVREDVGCQPEDADIRKLEPNVVLVVRTVFGCYNGQEPEEGVYRIVVPVAVIVPFDIHQETTIFCAGRHGLPEIRETVIVPVFFQKKNRCRMPFEKIGKFFTWRT
jgi:hypothetical protein